METHVYSDLENSISNSLDWSSEMLFDFFQEEKNFFDSAKSSLVEVILGSSNPVRAAQNFLINIAPDTMAEGAALSRRLLGAFGQVQLEFFKILVDEYGNGMLKKKHSYLYLEMIKTCGLQTGLHQYWNFYTPASLVLQNYFHYLSKNTQFFFRYLGKLFFAEASFANFCQQFHHLFREIYGDKASLDYFTEHAEVDISHGKIVLEKILKPVIEKFGRIAIKEILIGYQAIKYLVKINNRAFKKQIWWMDSCESAILSCSPDKKLEHISLNTVSQIDRNVHDFDVLLTIKKGYAEFIPGYGCKLNIYPHSDPIHIPAFSYYMLIYDKNTIFSLKPTNVS